MQSRVTAASSFFAKNSQSNMAAVFDTADMTITKNSKILVNVEEALADLIVVSYITENKQFQGVLLDSHKCNLPFGVYSLNPAFKKSNIENKDDKLHTVSQRFVYQEPQYSKQPKPKIQQRQKMTVRLRPRKVLCSKCKGICNENSENVDVARKRKFMEHDSSLETESVQNVDIEKKFLMGNSLIPKLSRLNSTEISNAIKGTKNKPNTNSEGRGINKSSNEDIGDINRVTRELTFVNVSDEFAGEYNCDITTEKSEPTKETCDSAFTTFFSNAKTLKICFGEGEGTVVKIPALVGDYNEDSGVCDLNKRADPKAARKALKKAKKQAKKIANNHDNKQSPKHLGALSPRNNLSDNVVIEDPLEKKHKHKAKHKKKDKLQRKMIRDENLSKTAQNESIGYFSNIKQHCLKQKLSISLRRLSSNSYERRSEDAIESGSEGWESDTVPEFPAAGSSSMGGQPLSVAPGDIVWGKIIGFPWWPGRVTSVTPSSYAYVSWYASTTSSLMPCDRLSPFLEDFKVRYNKKKRGPYKEAVKQATQEAQKNESHNEDPLASPIQGESGKLVRVALCLLGVSKFLAITGLLTRLVELARLEVGVPKRLAGRPRFFAHHFSCFTHMLGNCQFEIK
ncbi:PWWP domain-containing protein 2A [Eumeta japonica]|uniref:PWWP domain-containing protein 2A n=1 Tax=Eumeta variegata TaxID=151549 RepID=A0A4C1ZK91_EUMVA|nr:PWWP domain-containing protein 2A [Eumeta japonica]